LRRIGHLFEQIVEFGSLCDAARRAARGLRGRRSVAAFMVDLEPEVLALQRELVAGSYRPRPFRTFVITDPKPRTISAAAFRDRLVHHAVCAAMEPVFERYAIHDSYACRRGKGNHAAVRRVQALSRRMPWYGKLDVRHFFENVDLEVLMDMLRRRFKDRRALDLVQVVLDAGARVPGKGLPIGNLTSQHFANLYLGHMDHIALEELRIRGWVRYMDDVILFGSDREIVGRHQVEVERYLATRLRLVIRAEATIIAPVHVGIPFLGFRIWPRQVRLDRSRARRFRERFRALERGFDRGAIDEDSRVRAACSLVGWAEQADSLGLRRSFFARRRAAGHGAIDRSRGP
jgi:RNA-directed DNA polymerase